MDKRTDAMAEGEIKADRSAPVPAHTEELFGHVTQVEGYALTNYLGCHALVALRDTPGKTVAVLTSEQRLQSLLETALATGNAIAFWGAKALESTHP